MVEEACVCKCVYVRVEGGGPMRGSVKVLGGKKGWGETDRQEKERGHVKEGERSGEEEREVVSGGGGCWSVEMSVAH